MSYYDDPEGDEPGSIDWHGYDIRNAGRAAAKAGGKLEDNPCAVGTEDHWNWEFGFKDVFRMRDLWRKMKGMEPPEGL